MPESCHIFGVRHHGPGSAHSLRRALEALAPDCILVEGPPDAEAVLALALDEGMKPPVAILIHEAEKPQRAVYYPFAVFSPEWQAIQLGLSRKVPVRFMDLPQTIQMAVAAQQEAKTKTAEGEARPTPGTAVPEAESKNGADTDEQRTDPQPDEAAAAREAEALLNRDPISYLAQAAGFSDSERWWEHMVEHRHDSADLFSAILEAITALRDAAIQSHLGTLEPEREAQREAWMRQTIRAAQGEGFQRIAVVCGAWHAPALAKMPPAKDDAALLKGLPKTKVSVTWIPWTYGRLASASGYGAGIASPGWYDFLFATLSAPKAPVKTGIGHHAPTVTTRRRGESRTTHPASTNIATRWLAKVAHLLRAEDLDASSASVIEAVRLAETIAALRGRPLPGLPELNEATQTVLCFGDPLPLRLIEEKLIVSERLGTVPESTPMVPLAQDLAREQKRLRLPPEATQRVLDLDPRAPTDLDRSRLLHRLNLLGIAWGKAERGSSRQQGTFHELWRLQWQPEFAVSLIEAGVWGNTLSAAATAYARHNADRAPDLPTLTTLLDATLLADLPEAVEHTMTRLQAEAAVAADVAHLMGALPPLANILRYGNVRQTDAAMVGGVVDGLVTRICIGLPGACGSLNDEAAEAMFQKLLATDGALALLQNASNLEAWHAVLRQLADSPNLHGLVAGRSCRLLLEAKQFDPAEAARRLGLALSAANPPAQAAAWAEGFLRGSGLLLLHDETLWQVLDDWVLALSSGHFDTVVALLRRTFATFESAERRQMGERVARGVKPTGLRTKIQTDFDEERAIRALPLVAKILGLRT